MEWLFQRFPTEILSIKVQYIAINLVSLDKAIGSHGHTHTHTQNSLSKQIAKTLLKNFTWDAVIIHTVP